MDLKDAPIGYDRFDKKEDVMKIWNLNHDEILHVLELHKRCNNKQYLWVQKGIQLLNNK